MLQKIRSWQILALAFICMSLTPLHQHKDMWNVLAMVKFNSRFDPATLLETQIPEVSPAVEKWNGEQISIEGYIIPLTGQTQQSHFMLSRYPQSTCFFCGKAGPETAMQVFMKNQKKVKISERKVKVKGILYVNPKDINSLLYTLDEAEILED